MKAPEHFSSPSDNGARSINYSMLPPDKLPNWLLEKKAPEKIYNFSMRPPGNQERTPSPAPVERKSGAGEVFFPPAPTSLAERPVIQTDSPAAPEFSVQEKPLGDIEVQPAPLEISQNQNDLPEVVELETPQTPAINNVIAEETATPPDPLNWPTHHSAALEPPLSAPLPEYPPVAAPVETPLATPEWPQAPTIPAAPQHSLTHGSRPASPSLGDWIYNNSTTTMIIVIGIIVFAVLIMVLLELGVI